MTEDLRSAGHPGSPEKFDPVLIQRPVANDEAVGKALEGVLSSQCQTKKYTLTDIVRLQIACVKCVFALTLRFSELPLRLAYVEWFKPLRRPDVHSHPFTISPSMRQGQPRVEIVLLEDIIQSIHLIPKFGTDKDPPLTAWNVFERAKEFHIKSSINFHTYFLFHRLKLQVS